MIALIVLLIDCINFPEILWEEKLVMADLYLTLKENEEIVLMAAILGMTGIMMIIDYFWNVRK